MDTPGDEIPDLERRYWAIRRQLTDPDDTTPPHERSRLRKAARRMHLDFRTHRESRRDPT